MSSKKDDEDELRSLITGSSAGALTAIPLGFIADFLGGIGFFPIEGLVRWIAGNADTAGEVVYTIRRKRSGHQINVAKNYVLGELIGTCIGPIILILFHTAGTSIGIDPYGPLGVFIAATFAHSDNIGGMIADLFRRTKREGKKNGIRSFLKSPYMQGNIIFIALSICVSLYLRLNGFAPKENVLAGIEGSLMGFSDSLGAGLYAHARYWIHKKSNKIKQ